MRSRAIYATITLITILIFGFSSSIITAQTDSGRTTEGSGAIDLSLQKEIEHSIALGLKFLEENQEEDGSWSNYPGVTALAVTALLRAPLGFTEENNKAVARGLAYLKSKIHDNGGIYPDEEPQLRAYNTSIGMMAFLATNDDQYADIIRNARDYLISMQADEDENISIDDPSYGGIGYNREERSDISNMQWALEALKESEKYRLTSEATGEPQEYTGRAVQEIVETSDKELFWDKAIVFLQRCQNLQAYNDMEGAGNDGGFIYHPTASKAGGRTSYGSMTYAGMKSLIHADLANDDPRVQAAYNWIRANFTVDENPELGLQGLYYYYHSMAKALTAYGVDLLADTAGVEHNWREELASKLISTQHGDGYWVNENGRWWENDPKLATAYALLTIDGVLKSKEE